MTRRKSSRLTTRALLRRGNKGVGPFWGGNPSGARSRAPKDLPGGDLHLAEAAAVESRLAYFAKARFFRVTSELDGHLRGCGAGFDCWFVGRA